MAKQGCSHRNQSARQAERAPVAEECLKIAVSGCTCVYVDLWACRMLRSIPGRHATNTSTFPHRSLRVTIRRGMGVVLCRRGIFRSRNDVTPQDGRYRALSETPSGCGGAAPSPLFRWRNSCRRSRADHGGRRRLTAKYLRRRASISRIPRVRSMYVTRTTSAKLDPPRAERLRY